MNVRDLVPWTRGGDRDRNLTASQYVAGPFFTLHREVNRLFDDVFRGFDAPGLWSGGAWPQIEVEETSRDYKVTAELPGLEEKDVEIRVQDDVLILQGEKHARTEDRNRAFSERVYGRFERRIALDGASEANVPADFRNGLLTITVPKSARSQQRVRPIPINQETPPTDPSAAGRRP
jgi:HSP20 family protein